MMNVDLIKELLIIAISLSVITMAFIQKTKGIFKTSKFIELYSAIVNIVFAIVFCLSFTEVSILNSIWVGLFSFIGADTLYKAFEGKINSFSDIVNKKEEIIEIKRDDI